MLSMQRWVRRAPVMARSLVVSLVTCAALGCGDSGGGDDDVIVVSATGSTTTTESGGQVTVTVVLRSQPRGAVVIPVASSDTSEGTVSLNSVTFTTDNWNASRTITVTGVNDALTDGDQNFHLVFGPSTSTDVAFAGLTAVSPDLTNTDNDSAGVTVSAPSGNTHESAGTATFTVVLTTGPSSDVVIGLESSDPEEGVPDVASLTFTPENWNAPQTVTVTGVDDASVDGAQPYQIVFDAPTSDDAAFAALAAPSPVSLVNDDNDSPSVIVSAASGPTTESGGSATFTVRLGSPPTGNVVVHFDTDDSSEGVPNATSLTFDASNWSTPQTVTVTGVDDTVSDGNQSYAIVFTAQTGDDAAYNALPPPSDVALVNNDNDIAAISVTKPAAGSVEARTSEFGWTATFAVALTTQPTDTVTVHFDSNDATEGTPDVTSLEFTTTTWATPQTVTVTGADDAMVDGRQDFAIVFTAPTSADPAYSALPPPANVALSNYDDETPFRLRTLYAEGGASFYLAVGRFGTGGTGASSTHAVVTPLNDPTLAPDDYRFYLREGLSDTTGVSLESASFPNHYLRFDSVTPTRYPSCTESSTRSGQLCIWDFQSPAAREYLIWVEPFVDTATHRAEATFSLEGTKAASLFRSKLITTRLLRHASYQMVAWPMAAGSENTFVLEQ